MEWLAENLEEVALDREAEGFDPAAEGTPLVPISREAVNAMDDDFFRRVLRGVGVVPPANEQVRSIYIRMVNVGLTRRVSFLRTI